MDSLDIGVSDLSNPRAGFTLACGAGQMRGGFWFEGEPVPPEGEVKVLASAHPSPLEASGELYDLFGMKHLEIEDDTFVRALAQAMAQAGGATYTLHLVSDGGAVTEMTFALDGFGEAARPLRRACGW
jgi:hypothetical protein